MDSTYKFYIWLLADLPCPFPEGEAPTLISGSPLGDPDSRRDGRLLSATISLVG